MPGRQFKLLGAGTDDHDASLQLEHEDRQDCFISTLTAPLPLLTHPITYHIAVCVLWTLWPQRPPSRPQQPTPEQPREHAVCTGSFCWRRRLVGEWHLHCTGQSKAQHCALCHRNSGVSAWCLLRFLHWTDPARQAWLLICHHLSEFFCGALTEDTQTAGSHRVMARARRALTLH